MQQHEVESETLIIGSKQRDEIFVSVGVQNHANFWLLLQFLHLMQKLLLLGLKMRRVSSLLEV